MFDSQNSLLQIAVNIALKMGINNPRRYFLQFLDSRVEQRLCRVVPFADGVDDVSL